MQKFIFRCPSRDNTGFTSRIFGPLQDEILLYGQAAKNAKKQKETNTGNRENLHTDLFAIKTKGVKVLAF
jgi:hypothetical protein